MNIGDDQILKLSELFEVPDSLYFSSALKKMLHVNWNAVWENRVEFIIICSADVKELFVCWVSFAFINISFSPHCTMKDRLPQKVILQCVLTISFSFMYRSPALLLPPVEL